MLIYVYKMYVRKGEKFIIWAGRNPKFEKDSEIPFIGHKVLTTNCYFQCGEDS